MVKRSLSRFADPPDGIFSPHESISGNWELLTGFLSFYHKFIKFSQKSKKTPKPNFYTHEKEKRMCDSKM